MNKNIPIHVSVIGPWMNAVVPHVSERDVDEIHQSPPVADNELLKFNVRHAAGGYQYHRMNSVIGGNLYSGDAINLSVIKPAGSEDKIAPPTFSTRITNRVKAAAPSEFVGCYDKDGQTWRDIGVSMIGHIEGFLSASKTSDASKISEFTAFRTNAPDGTKVPERYENKPVRLDESFLADPAYQEALTAAHRKLRAGSLEPVPKFSGKMWSREPAGADTYWDCDVEFKWTTRPHLMVHEEVVGVAADLGTEFVVYGPTFAATKQSDFVTARDAHNKKLESALFDVSKGNALSSATETDLKTRPPASLHPVVVTEGDAWWNKNAALVAQLKLPAGVTGVTDSNLATKYPNGAAGMNANELDGYVKDKRAAGNTSPTKDLIDEIPKPDGKDKDKPWWDRVLDSVDGFGAGAKDVLKDWGPAGVVGAYGGVKAVNATKEFPWLWIGIAGAVILLLR